MRPPNFHPLAVLKTKGLRTIQKALRCAVSTAGVRSDELRWLRDGVELLWIVRTSVARQARPLCRPADSIRFRMRRIVTQLGSYRTVRWWLSKSEWTARMPYDPCRIFTSLSSALLDPSLARSSPFTRSEISRLMAVSSLSVIRRGLMQILFQIRYGVPGPDILCLRGRAKLAMLGQYGQSLRAIRHLSGGSPVGQEPCRSPEVQWRRVALAQLLLIV